MAQPITYKIHFDKLKQHLLRIECIIDKPALDGQRVSIPAWVPGSYLIRDFAKHIVSIRAAANGHDVSMRKLSKGTWQCMPCEGPLIVSYAVYCFDMAARGAYVDHLRVFFDGCRIFLVVEGAEEQTHTIELIRPPDVQKLHWQVATTMTPVQLDAQGFGTYSANNHLELIDHPVEISDFQSFEFEVHDVLHKIVITGNATGDFARLVRDVQKICTTQVDFFGELPHMPQYLFILSVVSKGGGGIEHRSSSSLLCNRNAFPRVGDASSSDEYKALLSLFSHEYFHIWNVKRIKPEVFITPNLQAEVYTRQLWIFEGITGYYDNLMTVTSGVIPAQDYLRVLQDDLNLYLQTPGAKVQTLEEASFDAWIKYYQPDENSVNSSVSYYLKGALVALLLDLTIIKNSKRKQSLADVMQVLWQQYGKTGLGLPEHHFERVVFEVTGEDYTTFFEQTLRTTQPLPLPELLPEFGVAYKPKAATLLDNLGLKIMIDQNKTLVKTVLNDSVAEFAGLCPNDIIFAINNTIVNNNLEAIISTYKENDSLQVHVFRNDVLLELTLLNPPLLKNICELELMPNLSNAQELNQRKWLGV